MTTEHYCKECNNIFEPYPQNLKKGYAVFCSMKCYNFSRGRNPGYHAVHKWLKDKFGKADRCENNSCNNISKNYNWALKKNCEYIKDRNNFIRFCISCHRKYDFTEKQRDHISKFMKTRITSIETRNKMSKFRKGIKLPKEWCKNISEGKKREWKIRKRNV